MKDIQKQVDTRKIPIDKVGIRNLSYPVSVLDKANQKQNTIALIDMSVDLPQQFRGTHMSRFIEVLNSHRDEITLHTVGNLLRDLKKKLDAGKAEISVKFPYFVEKSAPLSRAKSLLRYDCRFFASYTQEDDFVLSVKVPVTSLCPCSKALSQRSAHNQRSLVSVSVRFSEFIWIEDLITIVETSGSAEVFTLLKRQDEKFLTEQAYERPRFVEDIVREVAIKLDKLRNILWYAVETENLESIHAHSAYAFLKRDRRHEKF